MTKVFRVGNCAGFSGDRVDAATPVVDTLIEGELLNTLAGIELTGIPYKSSAQMTTDGIGGQIEVLFHNAQASVPTGNTPEEYDAFIRAEIVKWSKVVKQTNVQAD